MDRAHARVAARSRAPCRRPRRQGRILGVRRRHLGRAPRRALVRPVEPHLARPGSRRRRRSVPADHRRKAAQRHGSRRRRGLAAVSADHRHAGGRRRVAQRHRARLQRLGLRIRQKRPQTLLPRGDALDRRSRSRPRRSHPRRQDGFQRSQFLGQRRHPGNELESLGYFLGRRRGSRHRGLVSCRRQRADKPRCARRSMR